MNNVVKVAYEQCKLEQYLKLIMVFNMNIPNKEIKRGYHPPATHSRNLGFVPKNKATTKFKCSG